MDLAEIKPIEKRYNLTHPGTGEETGMIVVLACTHDDRVKKAARAVNDEIIRLGRDMTKEQEDKLDAQLVAAYIVNVEFTGEATWHGKTPEYSQKLAEEICTLPALKEQIMREVRKVKDFYKA